MKIMSIWKQTAENEDNNSKQYDEFNAAFDYVYNTKREKGNELEDLRNYMAIEQDYEYGDEWDWDKNDSSQYCEHGKFIGSWWGPDILCGKCEAGDGPMNIDWDDEF